MSELRELLEKRELVAQDLAALIDSAVASQSGLSGIALKTAVSGAKKVRPDLIQNFANRALPSLLDLLQPHWANYQAQENVDFGRYLEEHNEQVSAELLEFADKHADKIDVKPLAKAYSTIRSKADKLLAPHYAELGALLERHMA